MQVSFSFLTNLLRVIKSMLEITEGDGPTLLELLGTASIASAHTHTRVHIQLTKTTPDLDFKTKFQPSYWHQSWMYSLT